MKKSLASLALCAGLISMTAITGNQIVSIQAESEILSRKNDPASAAEADAFKSLPPEVQTEKPGTVWNEEPVSDHLDQHKPGWQDVSDPKDRIPDQEDQILDMTDHPAWTEGVDAVEHEDFDAAKTDQGIGQNEENESASPLEQGEYSRADWSYDPVSGRWSWVQNGQKTEGWEKIDGTWYYFSPHTGWMQTGWLQEGKIRYYLDQSGAMKTGWLHLKDSWYYFYQDGRMAVDVWIEPENPPVLTESGYVEYPLWHVGSSGIWDETMMRAMIACG